MASVSYRKVGDRWHIRFQAVGRKEITKSYPGSLQERTIQKKADWFEEQITLGREDPWEEKEQQQKGVLLRDAIQLFIDENLNTGRWKVDEDGKSNTANSYKMRLNAVVSAFGNIPARHLNVDDIEHWLLHKEKLTKKGKPTGSIISPVTMKSWKTSINTFFKWLHQQQFTEDRKIIYLSEQAKKQARQIIKQPTGISHSQLQQFCQGVQDRITSTKKSKHYHNQKSIDWLIPCAKLCFWIMLRREEIINLYPEDISENYEYITIGSEGSARRPRFIPKSGIATRPLLKPAKKVFQEMNVHDLPPGNPIFDYSYDYIYVAFYRVSKSAFENIIYSPHTFRHGGIIHLRSIIKQPGLVTYLARHSSQEVTEFHYGGVDPVYMKRALEEEGLS